MEGRIVRLVKDKGFGFISAEGRKTDYFFHNSALKNISFEDVKIGMTVQFEAVVTDRGLRAEDIYVD